MLWEFCFWRKFRFFWKHEPCFLLSLTLKGFLLTWECHLTYPFTNFSDFSIKVEYLSWDQWPSKEGLTEKMSLCFICIYHLLERLLGTVLVLTFYIHFHFILPQIIWGRCFHFTSFKTGEEIQAQNSQMTYLTSHILRQSVCPFWLQSLRSFLSLFPDISLLVGIYKHRMRSCISHSCLLSCRFPLWFFLYIPILHLFLFKILIHTYLFFLR
jgi:hypothetical protein